CGPSRMSLMSSCLASEVGCLNNTTPMSSAQPTFAHAFLRAGYETLLAGRMHFVGGDQHHGFEQRLVSDVTTAGIEGGWRLDAVLDDLKDTTGYSRTGILKSGPGHTGYHAYDRVVTRATTDWLRRRAGSTGERPFMMVTGFV